MIDLETAETLNKLVAASGDRFDYGGLPILDIFDTLSAALKVVRAAQYAHRYIDCKSAADEAIFERLDEALSPFQEKPENCGCEECREYPHRSDCAVHNEPAYPNGPCDCRFLKPEK